VGGDHDVVEVELCLHEVHSRHVHLRRREGGREGGREGNGFEPKKCVWTWKERADATKGLVDGGKEGEIGAEAGRKGGKERYLAIVAVDGCEEVEEGHGLGQVLHPFDDDAYAPSTGEGGREGRREGGWEGEDEAAKGWIGRAREGGHAGREGYCAEEGGERGGSEAHRLMSDSLSRCAEGVGLFIIIRPRPTTPLARWRCSHPVTGKEEGREEGEGKGRERGQEGGRPARMRRSKEEEAEGGREGGRVGGREGGREGGRKEGHAHRPLLSSRPWAAFPPPPPTRPLGKSLRPGREYGGWARLRDRRREGRERETGRR
jgi:hypothetical protein